MSSDEPVEPFDGSHVEAVAAERDVDPDRLTALVTSHQELMATRPGVEDLVYEWRKRFGATIVARSADAYFVAAPAGIWQEFGEHLDASDSELAALAEVHARAVQRRTAVNDEFADATPCVLRRS